MAKDILEYTLYLRKDKMDKKGRMPIYIRFPRIDGREAKFPMGKSIAPELWDEQNHCALDKKIAAYLKEQESRIYKEISRLQLEDREITKDELKDIVANKVDKIGNPENHSFYAYFEDYITISRKKGLAEGTLKVYETTLKSLKSFRSEIRVKDINAKLIEDFDKFLIKRGRESGKGDVLGSRYNRHKNIRTIIKYISQRGINIYNPWATGEIIIPKCISNDTYLTRKEVMKLYDLLISKKIKLGSPEYRVLAMFLFACCTGLRIGDTLNLKWDNFISIPDDALAISIQIQKNKKPITIKIDDFAEEILKYACEGDSDKIDFGKYVFHHQSQNNVNRILRKVAAMADIDKYITFHVARKTLATRADRKDISRQTISRYLGHSSVSMTERYIKRNVNHAESLDDDIYNYKIHIKKKLKEMKLLKE